MQGVERRLDGIAQQLFGDRDRFRPGHQQVIDNTRAGRVKFGGRAESLESIMGDKPIGPAEMTKKLWAFIKKHRLAGK